MNKVLNINLAGTAFIIDENAYEQLNSYLDTLDRHFSKSDNSKEIMQDIESRISEIMQEKLQQRNIITKDLVDNVITIMGTPKDLGAESNDFDPKQTSTDWGIHLGKKLFRDSENKKIAGVCSGLSHYLGIEDPIFLRIAFVIGLGAGGSTLLLYLILWFVTKPAVTASDYLQMKGMPINIDNIASKVEEKFVHLTNKIEDLFEKSNKKK
ncbi:MAG: PspC domain-containing protein [Saprospiraceae bacterium]